MFIVVQNTALKVYTLRSIPTEVEHWIRHRTSVLKVVKAYLNININNWNKFISLYRNNWLLDYQINYILKKFTGSTIKTPRNLLVK